MIGHFRATVYGHKLLQCSQRLRESSIMGHSYSRTENIWGGGLGARIFCLLGLVNWICSYMTYHLYYLLKHP